MSLDNARFLLYNNIWHDRGTIVTESTSTNFLRGNYVMKIDILIDKLTPCLIEVATGRILQTIFCLASTDDVPA